MSTNPDDSRLVLVVGGAGYVGTGLSAHLLEAGYRVRCLDLLLYENGQCVIPFLLNPNYEFQHGDIADREAVATALAGATDVVFLAALVGDPITHKYPEASHAINEVATEKFFDACRGRGLDRFIFVSTCSNYGMIEGDQVADENFELKPLSAYARAKVKAEEVLLGPEEKIDFHPTVLRFATAFGVSPRMRFDLTVSEFTRSLFFGQALEVYDPDTWRPYCHVSDFSRLIQLVLEAPADTVAFEIFNAGGDANNFTKRALVETILAQIPDAPVTFRTQGKDPRNYRVDFAKVSERLAFTPVITVNDGVQELVRALNLGLFGDEVDQHPRFHGNIEIQYPT